MGEGEVQVDVSCAIKISEMGTYTKYRKAFARKQGGSCMARVIISNTFEEHAIEGAHYVLN